MRTFLNFIPARFVSLALVLFLLFIGIVSVQSQGGDQTAFLPLVHVGADDGWGTVAANPQRTSWTPEEVTGFLNVDWYRPIEGYISQNVQIIAQNGLLYIATANGLYAINASNGATAWRFDTEMPLGNSPTIDNGVLYVAGHDRKLHALNAVNGQHLWSFSGAEAGYDTNPLVVNGVIYAGNRDGKMYAIGGHGSANQGELLWQYETGGPIHLSAAFKDGVVYFASNDMHAYALNASSGALVWKSGKLPGLQFHSYWPVVFQDKVIFAVAVGYRQGDAPGTKSMQNANGQAYTAYGTVQLDDLFPDRIEGSTIGLEIGSQAWSGGYPIIDATLVTQYLEDNPATDPHKHKPWRRVLVALNRSDGSDFTFDSDGDGHDEFLPAGWWGTGSGNRYPPIVGNNDILYFGNPYRCCSDAKGQVMGWNSSTPQNLAVLPGFGALAEPQALSAGGNTIYRNLCCDRVGDFFSYRDANQRFGQLWSYNLLGKAPGYDSMWNILNSLPRLKGWYQGTRDTVNAAYHNHGDQNPIIPYQGRLYVHRSNAIIAFGNGNGPGQVAPLLINGEIEDEAEGLSTAVLEARLAEEVDKILDNGPLNPGYYNMSQFLVRGMENMYENPGDTLYTLSIAYPHLPPSQQAEVRTYLENYFDTYFDDELYARTGWADGNPREDHAYPPEVAADLANYPALQNPGAGFTWFYPQHNFYAMWKYAAAVHSVDPSVAVTAYGLAKEKLQVPAASPPVGTQLDWYAQQPYELNAWIAGYIGYLELQALANTDNENQAAVMAELNRLLALRASEFTKDSYWPDTFRFHKKHFDLARNFVFMVPELGDYLAQNIPGEVAAALDEYEYIAPYWFVSRYEGAIGESVMSNLYNSNALFRGRAYVLGQSQAELSKYIDAPAFARGDLHYIQNLIMALEAP